MKKNKKMANIGSRRISLEADFKRKQNQHSKRKQYEIDCIKENWNEKLERLTQLLTFNKDGQIYYYVEIRGTGLFSSTFEKASTVLEDAELIYDNFTETVKKSSLKLIDSYYPTAKKFILKYRDEGSRADFENFSQLHNIKFIIAVSELITEGFQIQDNNKRVIKKFDGLIKKSKKYFQDKKRVHRNVMKHFDDITISEENPNFARDYQKGLEGVIQNGLKYSTFKDYFFATRKALKNVFENFPEVYPYGAVATKKISKMLDTIKNRELRTAHNPTGLLFESEHYPMIHIDHLETILDSAQNISLKLYNFLILSLTTMMRPEEMDRLLIIGKDALDREGNLDYKSGKLVHKTDGKVKIQELPNPNLSTIGRVILKYNHDYNPSKNLVKNFFTKGAFWRKGELQKYVLRSLRRTGGHMLGFCIKCKSDHTSNLQDVKTRMAHKNTVQADNVYAKNFPHQTQLPEGYFRTAGIIKNGKLITQKQPLWDAYLLKHWIQTMEKHYKKSDMKIIWKQVLTEAHDYLNTIDPSGDTFIPDEM